MRRRGRPTFVLPEGTKDRYLSGMSANRLATEVGATTATVMAALRREGIECRTVREARKLLDPDEISRSISAGHQGIPMSEWKEYKSAHWNRVTHTPEYGQWRRQVYARDGYRCLLCDANKPLEAHHIYKKSLCPERMLDVSNGVTLCAACHRRVTHHEPQWAPIFERLLNEALASTSDA